jgi:hypothetical protein
MMLASFGGIAVAQDDKQSVCKDAAVPVDRVIVSGFQSAACSPPNTINAWDTVVPVEGTKVCQLSNTRSAANVLKFQVCEQTTSDDCPSALDGTANAWVLRSPASCFKHGLKDLRAECANWFPDLPKDDFIVGITNVENCRAQGQLFGNAFVVRERDDPYEPFMYCAPEDGLLHKDLQWDEVVLRRFHSEYCDLATFNYVKYSLNTIVIMKIRRVPPPDLTLCDGTPMAINLRPFLYAIGNYEPGKVVYPYERLETLYDPLCGGPEKFANGTPRVNAARVLKSTGEPPKGAEKSPWW